MKPSLLGDSLIFIFITGGCSRCNDNVTGNSTAHSSIGFSMEFEPKQERAIHENYPSKVRVPSFKLHRQTYIGAPPTPENSYQDSSLNNFQVSTTYPRSSESENLTFGSSLLNSFPNDYNKNISSGSHRPSPTPVQHGMMTYDPCGDVSNDLSLSEESKSSSDMYEMSFKNIS